MAVLLLGSFLSAEAAEFRLDLARTAGESAVTLRGEPEQEYLLESSTGLGAAGWSPLGSFVLTNEARVWRQPGAEASRFFRARAVDSAEAAVAPNFRLIDQDGKSRELYYYSTVPTVRAFVLIFTEGNYAAFAPKIAALKANAAFQNKVLFWTIDTSAGATRTNIKAQATAAGVTWPVFHDPLQLTMRAYDAHFSGEVLVVPTDSMNVAYRGVIDDGAHAYLATALSNVVQEARIVTTRLEPAVGKIARLERPVADYSTVIAPLLKDKCANCHSPGNIGEFEMTSHATILQHRESILEQVMTHQMPPWHADPEFGKFKNDTSLTAAELSALVDWLEAGGPRGGGAVDVLTEPEPAVSKWPADLGEPDQIVKIPQQSINATNTEPYRYIYANATNAQEKWLRAAVVRPSNRKVVHHYIVWNGHSSSDKLSGIATYVPGRTNVAFPTGTGVRLPANAPLTFNLHYTPTGENAEVDEPELGLWYAATPPAKEMKIAAPLNIFFAIPPGNPEFEVGGLFPQSFSVPTRVYSLSPHMHVRGLRMKFELSLPGVDGKKTILSVPNYSFDWQTIYYLDPPLDVPAGAAISLSGAFDNSDQNEENPDSSATVRWGEQSWEEMFIGYIEYSDR